MSELPEGLFLNPVWHSLRGPHRHLGIDGGGACRYPADVTPFAALAEPSAAALRHLGNLLSPADPVWIVDACQPHIPELSVEGNLECLQMVLPPKAPLPAPAPALSMGQMLIQKRGTGAIAPRRPIPAPQPSRREVVGGLHRQFRQNPHP